LRKDGTLSVPADVSFCCMPVLDASSWQLLCLWVLEDGKHLSRRFMLIKLAHCGMAYADKCPK
jgi:hypothetical protein